MTAQAPFAVDEGYDSQLSPIDEFAFRQWAQDNHVPFNANAPGPTDYDMRGYWRDLQSGAPMARPTEVNPNDNRPHFTDYYKTPLHQTFSAESQWAPPNAPRWINDHQLATSGGRIAFDERRPVSPLGEWQGTPIKEYSPWPEDVAAPRLTPVDHDPFDTSDFTLALNALANRPREKPYIMNPTFSYKLGKAAGEHFAEKPPFDWGAFGSPSGEGDDPMRGRQVEATVPLALGAAIGGTAFAPRGSLGTFGGRLSFTEQMQKGKELAERARSLGRATGKSAPGWDYKPAPAPEKGSYEQLRQLTNERMAIGNDLAREDYLRSVFPERYQGFDNSMARKPYSIYNAPDRPPHPEIVDYPHGTPADASGRITETFTGDPVRARYLVGRNVVGGEKVALPPQEYDAITEALTGARAEVASPREMGSDLGRILINRSSGRPEQIYLRSDLPADRVGMVHAHELGHAVSQRIGPVPYRGLPVEGLSDALKRNYNTLNNPNRASGGLEASAWGKPTTPKSAGYPPHDVVPELTAEAFRAALTNPNYMSVQHPELYRRMAQVVNKDPWLSKILQFNTLLGAGLVGGASLPDQARAHGLNLVPVDHDPFASGMQ